MLNFVGYETHLENQVSEVVSGSKYLYVLYVSY